MQERFSERLAVGVRHPQHPQAHPCLPHYEEHTNALVSSLLGGCSLGAPWVCQVGMQERFSERAQLWVSAISSALKHKPASPTLGSSTGCGGGSMSSIAGTVGSSIGGSLGHTHSMGGAAGHSSGGSMGHNMSSAAAAAVSGGGVGGGRDGVRGGLQDPSEGGDVSLSSPFEQLAFRQLAGLLICVW